MDVSQQFNQLGNLADITMGQSPDSSSVNSDERGLPFLQGCAEFGRQSPEAEFYCKPPLRVSKSKSILISVRAPVGTMNWGDQNYCIGRGLAAIKGKQGVADTKFLACSILQNVSFLHRRSQGSTFLAISANDLKLFPIPNFSPAKQEKISWILQTIDQTIELTEALIEKYQQIKAGLMHDLFTRGIGADGQLRPPREQAPELYQKTPIGWIPKEWGIVSLEDSDIAIIDGDRGENYPQGHELLNEGFCLFLSATNVTNNGFKFEKTQFISEEKNSLLGTGSMHLGDVVITTRGTVGNIAYFDNTIPHDEIRINSGMVILRSRQKDLTTDFLYCSLRNYIFNREYKRVISGSAQPQLPIKDFKRFTVLIPSLDEQNALVIRASSVDIILSRENRFLEKLKKQKSGLMHDLLTGKVSVNVDPPEAAHV